MDDLDTQIAERVMGWHLQELVENWEWAWYDAANKRQTLRGAWHPSTSWADAGRVLDHTQLLQDYNINQSMRTSEWLVWNSVQEIIARVDNGPEAICHAALAWVQEQKK